jgi:2-phosphoglycerate kinase
MGNQLPNWNVLLIGGSSGTGKTLAAKAIAHQLGVACAQLDDFRLVLEAITTPSQQPALHVLNSAQTADNLRAEEMCERLVDVAHVMSKAIEPAIAHHVATEQAFILEGDGLLPGLATQRHNSNLDVQPRQVRFVLLYEPSEAAIFSNMTGRKRGIDRQPEAIQQKQARAAWLYGEWLRGEALRHNVAIVESAPWQTVTERIIAAAT